jgi:hypothetical protein
VDVEVIVSYSVVFFVFVLVVVSVSVTVPVTVTTGLVASAGAPETVMVVVSVTVPVTVTTAPVASAGAPETVMVKVVVDAAQLLLVVDVAAAELVALLYEVVVGATVEEEFHCHVVVMGALMELVELDQSQEVVVEVGDVTVLDVMVALETPVALVVLLVQV